MELWAVPEGVNLQEKFQPKRLKHTKYDLSREQIKLLKKQGHKYYQLMDGTIQPITHQQRHFVAVCNNLAEPETEWENIWKSYLATIEEEKRLELIYHENLRHSTEGREYLDHLWLAGTQHLDASSDDRVPQSTDRSRPCPICRGSGMKSDGAACDRCNGRGSIA